MKFFMQFADDLTLEDLKFALLQATMLLHELDTPVLDDRDVPIDYDGRHYGYLYIRGLD